MRIIWRAIKYVNCKLLTLYCSVGTQCHCNALVNAATTTSDNVKHELQHCQQPAPITAPATNHASAILLQLSLLLCKLSLLQVFSALSDNAKLLRLLSLLMQTLDITAVFIPHLVVDVAPLRHSCHSLLPTTVSYFTKNVNQRTFMSQCFEMFFYNLSSRIICRRLTFLLRVCTTKI